MNVPRYFLLEYCAWLREEGLSSVTVYGAGATGLRFLECARSCGLSVERFVDGNAKLHGSTVEGLRVSSLHQAAADGVTTFVIASIAYDLEIAQQIEATWESGGLAPPRIFTIPWGLLEGHSIPGTISWPPHRAAAMKHRTRISVLIPTIRSGDMVATAMRTLFDSTLPGVEYLVGVDRAPLASFEPLLSKYPGLLRVIPGAGGLAPTLNKLIDEAAGEYIARADDDDTYLPGRLRTQLDYLDGRPDVDFVGAAMDVVRNGRVVGRQSYPGIHEHVVYCALFECLIVAHPLVMGRAEPFKTLRYRPVAAEDYDLWVRAILAGHRFANLEVPLLRYTKPTYSAEKNAVLAGEVVERIATLLSRQFGIADADATEFAHVLSLREKRELPRARMRELWARFADALSERELGLSGFRDCAVRFAPHLVPSLEAFMDERSSGTVRLSRVDANGGH